MPRKKSEAITTEAVEPAETTGTPAQGAATPKCAGLPARIIVAVTAVLVGLLIVGTAFAGGIFIGRAGSRHGRGAMMENAYCGSGMQRQGGQNYRNGPNGGGMRFQGQNSRKNGGGQRRLRNNSPQNNAPNTTPNITQ